ncbi:hypothetical protein [Ktedonobacter racemifer]|uniref:Uncharacterized protein n=1 Tax=Ktedonobacter racemifer DSM 44963 TaxID=485913 RepID=D6U303_KTERA|nr:hypothetical protein [Ktedonobacter racemifer]EFH82908.1 hypothetical protein Krac_3790 [Ktedonobacter racemifer DSM 44963]
MSTPACIALTHQTSVHFVYLSQDGYPAYAGQILLQHYNTLEHVEQLLTGGNLYRLEPVLGDAHDFFEAQNDAEMRQKTQTWCQFKLRDYDRRWSQPTDEQAQELGSLLLLLNQQQQTPWTYVFRAGQWYLYSSRSREETLLQEALNNHKEQ